MVTTYFPLISTKTAVNNMYFLCVWLNIIYILVIFLIPSPFFVSILSQKMICSVLLILEKECDNMNHKKAW